MILSYHPMFRGDKNLICAGREPSQDDLFAIREADAVILSQGCYESLYRMARSNCSNVFPNLDAKFDYPGKTGQVRLLEQTRTAHPRTEIFSGVSPLFDGDTVVTEDLSFAFPFVFKFDWGGEGKTVYLIRSSGEFEEIMNRAKTYGEGGQKGFLLQEYIPSQRRSLRVVVIGRELYAYWRVQASPGQFHSGLTRGGTIDSVSDPELLQRGITAARTFCKKTGINLAGFDYLLPSDAKESTPLLLEINYFFGRRGLGGSDRYYELLISSIGRWLRSLGLQAPGMRSSRKERAS